MFMFVLGLLENTLEQSSIEVLGHKIKAEIEQKRESKKIPEPSKKN